MRWELVRARRPRVAFCTLVAAACFAFISSRAWRPRVAFCTDVAAAAAAFFSFSAAAMIARSRAMYRLVGRSRARSSSSSSSQR